MKDLKNQHEDTRFSSPGHGKRGPKNFKQQPRVANRADQQTVKNYTRRIEGLMDFLGELPGNPDGIKEIPWGKPR